MKITRTLLTATCAALTLTACGGGSGGSSLLSAAERPAPTPVPTPSTQTSENTNTPSNSNTDSAANTGASSLYTGITPAKPSTNNQTGSTNSASPSPTQPTSPNTGQNSTPSTANTGVTGFANTINHATLMHSYIFGNTDKTANTTSIDKIVIDGKTIDLTKSSVYTTGTKMSAFRYGYLHEQNEKSAFFAQGVPTQTMPTQGVATYRGSAIHSTIGESGVFLEKVATAQFQVDFGKKTLEGKINSFSPVELSATISGNSFSGTKGDMRTMGYFYGENAAELGGIYANEESSIAGSFGAKK